MQLRLDTATAVPPFEQIRAQIALQVAAGRLRAGDRLPTIRVLADRLDVAPNTVARAYRELILSGICVAAGRRGTFVAETPPVAFDVATRSEVLADAAVQFARTIRSIDIAVDEALEAVIAAMRLPDDVLQEASDAAIGLDDAGADEVLAAS
ncbi:MAG: GntR family transcriptional regulator [Actinomycetota bacterium]